MNFKSKLTIAFLGLFFTTLSYGQNNSTTTEYLNIPGPLKFDKTNYNFIWSSHPTDNYYKQEYISKGDNIDNFSKMVLIDVIISDTLKLEYALASKIAELEERKKTDPVVNYKMFNNPDKTEYIIDFVESEGTEAALHIVEWNAYRYKIFTDTAGHKGVMLFGVSMRAYDNKIRDFFGSLKDTRNKIINVLIGYDIPQVTIANK